ncbi:MAG: replication-relaxation family protein, partial [Ktedonobacteraceae bacterium]|nr:replication-relaxation family protein [Ktedonobacteraceae bacterium]
MQKRAPKLQRAPEELKSTALTERSLEVLDALVRFRLLSTSQIMTLVEGNGKVTHRHLQKLFHLGLVDRSPLLRNGTVGEFVYLPSGSKSLKLLAARGQMPESGLERFSKTLRRDIGSNISGPGRTLFLEHELMVSRFHMLLELACRETGGDVVLKVWRQGSETWNTVRVVEGDQERVLPHRPDAVFTLEQPNAPEGQGVSHFFYEADRGTSTAGRMLDKLKAHLTFLLQGKHREKYGFNRLRAVLIEAPTLERAEQIREWARAVSPSEPLFWITLSDLLQTSDLVVQPGSP